MKRKKLKQPCRCSFCKIKQTEFRIQGYPYYGQPVCDDCWPVLKKEQDEYNAKWSNREKSDGESQIPYI